MAKKKTKKEHGVLKIFETMEGVIAAVAKGKPKQPKRAKKKKR